jgi:hypothetical protein
MLNRFLAWGLTALACVDAGGVEPPAVCGVQITTEPRLGRGGIVLREGVAGTAEGHAIADMNYWISTGDCDLADVCFRFEHRAIGTPSATFVHAWALLRLAVEKRRGFERALEEFERVETDEVQLRSHIQALLSSVKLAAPCLYCGGRGKTRCLRCHGLQTRREAGTPGLSERRTACTECSAGSVACGRCDGVPKAPPSMEDICRVDPCVACQGLGLRAKNLRIPCPQCVGVGWRLTPKADPNQVLR